MNERWLGRDKSPIVAEDIVRARSTLLSVRAKIDTKGHNRVYAYGQALRHVARLISTTFDVGDAEALTARGTASGELDQVYRDLFSSARRCRNLRAERTPGYEMPDNLATTCSIPKNFYRMRFHSESASGSQKVHAQDLADRLTTLAQALSELEPRTNPARICVSAQMAA